MNFKNIIFFIKYQFYKFQKIQLFKKIHKNKIKKKIN